MNDLAFAEQLRALLHLKPNADLTFVSDPHVRAQMDGSSPGWLYRLMRPEEKRQLVWDYCGGASVSFLAEKFTRSRGSIVRVLKEVEIYKADGNTLSKFLVEGKIESWYAGWVSRYRKRQICAATAKGEEESL
jgi:hypothetical protein